MPVIQRKICLLGEFAVGKTSLIRRFVHNRFEADYLATIGVHISRKEVVLPEHDTTVVLVLWDLSGGEMASSLEEAYYRGGAGALLVADVLRPDTVAVLNTYAMTYTRINPGAALVFACNKMDLVPDETPYRLKLAEIAQRWRAPFFLTSARDGRGVEDAFRALAYLVARR
ncbi:MAG: Rab family GTPase [Anaerolineae bacterium]|nr:GTP-binding protein [Caldilineales bacterium]MDW8270427.1 Rab family GTPase [Anaerolineae bacterium]